MTEGKVMKKLYIISAFLVTALLYFSFTNTSSISYTESSTGLQTVLWDGGRTEIEFADINRDGFKDILSIGDHGNPFINTQEHGIMMYFGNGTGSNWSLTQVGNFGYGGIAIGDVNGDNKPDVAYGMHHNYSGVDLGDQILEVALGDGTGLNWTAWDDSLATHGETYGMFTTDLGDVDNDGKLDVGSVSFGCCAGVHIYKNLGTGTWRQTFGFTGGNSSMEFQFGDINNDGYLDFAVAHQNGTPYFGNGQGNFILMQNNLPPPGNSGYKGVSLGDVNNDGAKDLAFITGTGGGVNVWKWNLAAGSWDNLSGSLPSSSTFQATQLYDMNADGFCDLILYGITNMTIYAGDGGSSWTQIANFSTPANGSYQDIAVADADNNGFPDIALVANEGNGFNTRNYLRFFKETSVPGSMTIKPLYPVGWERLKNNTVRFIEWLSADPPPQNSKVKLEFSSMGSNGPWTLIADSLPNSGRYQWTVPPLIASDNCFIRYTVFEGSTSATGMNTVPFIVGDLVGISHNNNEMPGNYELFQNYPNPFNPVTHFGFRIAPRSADANFGFVKLKIYDAAGREVITSVNEELKPGTYEVEFDGSNLSSGVYYYTLHAGYFTETRKMMLVK
jgi:hypothetical protein